MLSRFFNNPDAYERDPLGYLQNQVGHVVLGYAAHSALQGNALESIWLLAAYFAWEWAQWRLRGAKKWDGWEDLAFVATGVVAVSVPLVLAPAVFHLWSGLKRREAE